jgi:hypothetical protein
MNEMGDYGWESEENSGCEHENHQGESGESADEGKDGGILGGITLGGAFNQITMGGDEGFTQVQRKKMARVNRKQWAQMDMTGFMGHINHMGKSVQKATLTDSWEEINVEVDSGAITHICGKETGASFPIKPTEFSLKGGYYRAANGTKIHNQGEKLIKGINDNGINTSMTFQIGDVSGPLGSVRKMVEAGNRVVFDSEGSYIEQKSTGAITAIRDTGDKYILKLWVQGKGQGSTHQSGTDSRVQKVTQITLRPHSGRFHALGEEENTQGFVGLGEHWI